MDEAAETGRDAAVERAERVVVDGDPIALRRLVTNLVDNALKFGSSARGRVFSEAGMAIVEVDDDGPGVPEATSSVRSSRSIGSRAPPAGRPAAPAWAWPWSAPSPEATAAR